MKNNSELLTIAIDGYSSCGKSSFAKRIAAELDYLYIDSGAMYRAFTLYCIQHGIIVDGDINVKRIPRALGEITIEFRNGKGRDSRTYLNGMDVEQEIRSLDVSEMVSPVSRISEVREKMVSLQREFSRNTGVVMDGRDIGTVVFPEADIKIFMTADLHIRAERRFLELKEKGIEGSLREIEKNLHDRDYMDENRKESPLRKAADAWILDNSNMDMEEQMEWFRKILRRKIK